jgi:hypothetical protein
MSSLVLSRDGKRIRETKKNEETAIRVLLLVIERGFVDGATRFCPLEFWPIAAVYKRGLLHGTGRFHLRRCKVNNQAIAWFKILGQAQTVPRGPYERERFSVPDRKQEGSTQCQCQRCLMDRGTTFEECYYIGECDCELSSRTLT